MRFVRAVLWLGLFGCIDRSVTARPGPADAGALTGASGTSDAGHRCPALPEAPGIDTVVTGLTQPYSIAVDEEYVYWLQGYRRVRNGNALLRAPKSGGPAELL